MGKMARQQKYQAAAEKSFKKTTDAIDAGPYRTRVGDDRAYTFKYNKKGVENDFPNIRVHNDLGGFQMNANQRDIPNNVKAKSTKMKNWTPGTDRANDTTRRPKIENSIWKD